MLDTSTGATNAAGAVAGTVADPTAPAAVVIPATTDATGAALPSNNGPVFSPAIADALAGASPAAISPATNDPSPSTGALSGMIAAAQNDLDILKDRFEKLLTYLQATDRGL